MTDKLDSRSSARAWALVVAGVALLAFGLRWYYVSTAVVYHPIRGDAVQYHAYAWNLAHHGVFSKSNPAAPVAVPDDYRDPGYPLFLAGWMKLLGNGATWYAAVLMAQALLGALTVLFAMLLGRYWLPARWVTAAGILMAIWPHSVVIDSYLLTETLFGFLCTLALFVCAGACKSRSIPRAIAAGFVFGAAALTNAVLLPFGLLLALFLAWRKLVPRRIWVALALAAVLLPGMWAIRNSQLPAQAATASSTDRALQNLVQGSWPTYHAAYRAAINGDVQGKRILASINSEYELLRSSPARGMQVILHRLTQHPGVTLIWYVFEKPRLFWGWSIRIGQGDIYVYPTMKSPFATQPVFRAVEAVCHALNPWLAAFALIGVVAALARAWRGRSFEQQQTDVAPLMVGLLLLFATLVYTALQSEPRYSIPFRALEILMAFSACRVLSIWVGEQRRARAEDTGSAPESSAPLMR